MRLKFLKRKSRKFTEIDPPKLIEPILDQSICAVTNVGLNREKNDDYTIASKNKFDDRIALVCDGLGGYSGGNIASKIVGESLLTAFLKNSFKNRSINWIRKWFVGVVNEAKMEISQYVAEHPDYHKMATTLALILATQNRIYCFNIGDSRIYGIKNDQIHQITVDENLYNQLKQQDLSESEISLYGQNLQSIVNYIGQFDESELKYQFKSFDLTKFDWLFATTDGVHNYIKVQDLLNNFLNYYALTNIAEHVINKALSQMSNDNLSIAIVKIKR